MKKFLTLLVLLPMLAFSQTEKENYKKVSAQFEELYNASEYEKIFEMFADEMKAALPLEQTKVFFQGLNTQTGKITSREFDKYVNGTFASYKTKFERALFAIDISVNESMQINGLLVKPFVDGNLPKLERNITKLILPFKEEWTVFWGGDTREQNYHIDSPAQKGAFDMIITNEDNKSYKTDGAKNEDYYAFGKELIAPCEGEIVLVVDGIKDNSPGEMNPNYVPGNSVVLKTENEEYLLFAHFKQHSIVVKQGQQVKQGDLLGLCGNSGNSSEPHLHLHIQNVEDMNKATGAKCYFEEIFVNGELSNDYSPEKSDKVKNK